MVRPIRVELWGRVDAWVWRWYVSCELFAVAVIMGDFFWSSYDNLEDVLETLYGVLGRRCVWVVGVV